ncbi:hypothetical protein [Fluviicola taffensis]|uniref:hypothetical protein n=1 Tax=Fluviicola taffensis TaxID=191579 RepID=UPI0031377C1E
MQDLLDEQSVPTQKTLRFRLWVILIWSFIFLIGYAFRIMHWPFSSILRVLGAGGFMAYSFSFLILTNPRTILTIVFNAISLFWTLLVIWGVFFNGGYPFNKDGATAQGIVFSILFLIHWGVLYLIKRVRSRNK